VSHPLNRATFPPTARHNHAIGAKYERTTILISRQNQRLTLRTESGILDGRQKAVDRCFLDHRRTGLAIPHGFRIDPHDLDLNAIGRDAHTDHGSELYAGAQDGGLGHVSPGRRIMSRDPAGPIRSAKCLAQI
jgi:hypothetical protein